MDPRQIGIITGDTGLFSNGLIQNAYFLHEVFTKLGHSCQLLSYSTTNVILEHVGIPVRTISDDPSLFNVSDYKTIVTVATGITQSMYAKCKANRVSVVGFICGNSMFMNLVDFTAEPPRNAVIGKERPVDALWIIGAYDFMKAYLELLRGAPATLVPHLWSPRLLEAVVIERFKKPISSLA